MVALRTAFAFLILAAAPAACSSGDSNGSPPAQGGRCADVCEFGLFDCSVTTVDGEIQFTAQIATRDAAGCTGAFAGVDDDDSFWIHCDTGQICVDDVDDCFEGSFGALSFSYVVTDKGNVVTCSAVTR